jgi:hypothetical protein
MIFAASTAFRIKNHPAFFRSQARTQWRKLTTKTPRAQSNTTLTADAAADVNQ